MIILYMLRVALPFRDLSVWQQLGVIFGLALLVALPLSYLGRLRKLTRRERLGFVFVLTLLFAIPIGEALTRFSPVCQNEDGTRDGCDADWEG